MKTWHRVAPGIYRHSSGSMYERPVINGRPTWRRLAARTVKLAKEELAAKRTDHARSAFGLAADPYASNTTVGKMCADYLAAGCPDARRLPRVGLGLKQETSRIKMLLPWWQEVKPQHIDIRTLDAYADARTSAVLARYPRWKGTRSVDLELNTLKNVFRLATRSGRLKHNPLDFRRPAYTNSALIKHCRESAPRSAEELHAHALFMFESVETEVYGWQLLFEAMTGCRTCEALALRTDGKTEADAGLVQGDVLWVARAKGGINNWVKIHPALSEWLAAFTVWRTARFPGQGASIWWFPGSDGQKGKAGGLSRVLRRSSALLHPGYNVTSHGLRSYYVTVRRCQGASDAQIAIELGQRTGPALIVAVYGDNTPTGREWIPKGKPAWEVWAEAAKEAK